MHPGRQLAWLGAVFVVLYLLVFFAFGAGGSFSERLKPKLGLDLVGGTQATYIASQQGEPPTQEAMETAREIIESRVNALGVSEAEVVIQGNNTIVVSLAGEAKDQLRDLSQAANMRFRLLTATTMDVSASALNPAPAASASAAPAPSANPSASGAAPLNTGTPPANASTPSASTGGQGGGAPAPSATPPAASAASGAPAAAPSAPASAPAVPAPAPLTADVKALRAEVEKKVGKAAWTAAEKLTAPVDLSTDPKAGLPFKAFGSLTGPEVGALTPAMQFNVPTIGCAQLDSRPNGSIDDVGSEVVACYEGAAKVMMDKAEVVGDDISNASPQLDQTQNQWVVSLDFKAEGQKKWTELTRKAFNATSTDPCFTAVTGLYGQADHCAVAVVLDKQILSAPQIQGVLSGQSQITGDFTAVSAKKLADQLNFGAIPVNFEAGPAETVSATLGIEQLEAGLLAAAIGMGLVAVYAFFYYRLLGSVIFLSLGLSALLTFGALVVLGRTLGFTLTLAGIAGFIVSLGVAADSFVIYFERLKDEIHEGRSPRSAVPRAWHRARRTIISANTITIMCAVVLYVVSIGAVQGFAFALGLSTVLDLLVVFLFRHPIMTMLASTKAFMSPRVSGLGRVLRTRTEEPTSSRVKEA